MMSTGPADGPKILVVSGHVGTAEALARALGFFGYDVSVAAGAVEALALLRQPGDRVDLLICDAGPPDNVAAAAAGLLIRAQAEYGIRGIAFGGHQEHGPNCDEVRAAGFEDYLAAPFTVDRLLAVVRRALAMGRAPVVGKN